MAAVTGGCRALRAISALCATLLLISVTVPVSLAAETSFNVRNVDRLPSAKDFTETLMEQPIWFRENFYTLPEELQLTFRFLNASNSDRITEMLEDTPAMDRSKKLADKLAHIAEDWMDAEGFDVQQEADDMASRDAVVQGRGGGGAAAGVNGRMSGALQEAGDPSDTEQPPSQPPVVVGPVQQFGLSSLWDLLKEARKAGNDTGLWRLSLSGADELVVAAVPRLDPAETVSLLPVYGRRRDARPELVQQTFPAGAASLQQLLRTPDELLRTLPERAAARLPARTVTAVTVEHAGDVTVTGALAAARADNMTDAELETLVHSLLQRPLTPAELAALADVVSRHWPDERSAWSPTHISVVAAHRCELLAHVSLPALLPLDSDTVAGLVRSCQNVWEPAVGGGGGGPALGPYVRRWLQKSLVDWSAADLSELGPLLVGTLPEELEQIGGPAGAALSFASLDRAQAQPVIARQLAAAEDLTAAGTLYELLRHLQPQHVRQLGQLRHQLLALSPWLMNDRQESGQYATHLQVRSPLTARENIHGSSVLKLLYNLGV